MAARCPSSRWRAFGAVEEDHVPVPVADQVVSEPAGGVEVVEQDRVRGDPALVAVHQHHREAVVPGLELRQQPQRRRQDHPAHVLVAHQVETGGLPFRVLVRVAEDHAQLVAESHVLHRPAHFREERVADVGHHQADGAGVAGAEPARGQVRTVAQAPHGLQDLAPRGLADRGPAAQHPRYGRHGNAGQVRDILDVDQCVPPAVGMM